MNYLFVYYFGSPLLGITTPLTIYTRMWHRKVQMVSFRIDIIKIEHAFAARMVLCLCYQITKQNAPNNTRPNRLEPNRSALRSFLIPNPSAHTALTPTPETNRVCHHFCGHHTNIYVWCDGQAPSAYRVTYKY